MELQPGKSGPLSAVSQFSAGALDPQGPVAEAIADLWWLMLWLSVAVFLLFCALLALALLRRPSGAGEGDRPDLVGRWIVGAGVALPVVVLIVIFGATIYAMRLIPATAPPDAVVVEIVGSQWEYEVHYPAQGITTTNELHMPVGRPVELHLTSTDVIHSFWVPALGGKMDMLPDYTNTLVLQADEPGEHRARCAEFCGLEHAHMEMVVIAEPADEFAEWAAEQR